MAKALKYLLAALKANIGPQEKDYRFWESIFPRAMRVKAKPSKATHLSQKSPRELLGIFGEEWGDSEDLVGFVDAARAVRDARDDAQLKAALVPLRMAVGDPDGDAVYLGFAQAALRSLAQTSVSFDEENHVDLLIGAQVDRHSGGHFAFLFEEDFSRGLAAQLADLGEFAGADACDPEGFLADYDTIVGSRLPGADEERRQVISLLALCLMACLVGPGRYADALGYHSARGHVDTLTPTGDEGLVDEVRDARRFRLQPIVMNGLDVFSYCTDSETAPVEFCRNDEVRIGRPAQGGTGWLESGVAMRLSCPSVSRMHAKLGYRPGKGWFIEDLGSSYGTLLIRARSARNEFLRGGSAPIATGDLIFLAPEVEVLDRAAGSSREYPRVGVRGAALRFERC